RGGERAGLGGVENQDSLGGGGVQVDIIDSDASAGDRLEFPGIGQDLGRHLGAGTDDQGVVLPYLRRQLLFLQANLGVKIRFVLFQEIEAFLGEFVSN